MAALNILYILLFVITDKMSALSVGLVSLRVLFHIYSSTNIKHPQKREEKKISKKKLRGWGEYMKGSGQGEGGMGREVGRVGGPPLYAAAIKVSGGLIPWVHMFL